MQIDHYVKIIKLNRNNISEEILSTLPHREFRKGDFMKQIKIFY